MAIFKETTIANVRLSSAELKIDRQRRSGKRIIGKQKNFPKPAHKRPKAILIRPPIVSEGRSINNEAVPAIGLTYVLSYALSQGYDVQMIDGIASRLNRMWELDKFPGFSCQGLTYQEIIDLIPADVEVIGFSIMFSGEWPPHRQLIKMVRKKFPQALLLAGGEHITGLSEYSLKDCPELDLCVHGEGEMTFVDILDKVRCGEEVWEVAGISYLDSVGNYQAPTTTPRIFDIDNLPWPQWP